MADVYAMVSTVACGDGLSEAAGTAIGSYVLAHGKGRLGVHRFDLAGFGLDESELAERLAPYAASVRHLRRALDLEWGLVRPTPPTTDFRVAWVRLATRRARHGQRGGFRLPTGNLLGGPVGCVSSR